MEISSLVGPNPQLAIETCYDNQNAVLEGYSDVRPLLL
jgi:hypothetical protein